MARGQLRVYLGSAPGVGKTYRMLDEGYRRRERGTDVVIGYVETHHRPLTDALVRDLEVVPRVRRRYRDAELDEMDVDAVLARRPDVALVDELAHTNAPGSTNEKRWQDVEALLDAGIDVITTVNIQHLESVNDVVEKITGIVQQETVPDVVVRRAEQVELVDVTPEALRRRMAHGNIYAADKIDASLSNYFRVGNLSALRELALLWLADRVEDALQRYLDDHDISATWETRERLIVGVTGHHVDEVLLRRAARMVSRSGAELIAVHVIRADTMNDSGADTSLVQELTAEFEGTYQEIVDDDVATALVAFARSERGTQIVLGASRPRSTLRPLGGVVEKVLRHSPDLDVHVIAVGVERPTHVHERPQARRFSWQRQVLALLIAAGVLPLLTIVMTSARSSLSLSTEFLAYLVVVLALATWGGILVGALAALAAFGVENFFFVPPLHTLAVARPDDVVSLVAFLVFAVGSGAAVSRFRRRAYDADRARGEARVLAKAVSTVGTSPKDLHSLLDSLRNVFAASGAAILVERDGAWVLDVLSGAEFLDVASAERFVIDDEHALVLEGVTLTSEDRQLVGAFASRVALGHRVANSALDASHLRDRAATEAKHSNLFRAASNDLRHSLDAMQRTLQALVDGVSTAPARVQRERLDALDVEVRRLSRTAVDLADIGRLDAGVVTPQPVETSMAAIVDAALASIDTRHTTLDVSVPDDLPSLTIDSDLAQHAIATVVNNACRCSGADVPVRITAGAVGDTIELLVVDRGPGMTPAQRAEMLTSTKGANGESSDDDLGMTVAVGFMKLLGGHVRFEDTPGGGLTVDLSFPLLGGE